MIPQVSRKNKGQNRIRQEVLYLIQESNRGQARTFRLPVAGRVVGGLALLILIGTIALMLPPMGTGRPLTLAEAFFTATSALTVTGLSTISAGTDLTFLGQIVLLLLIQLGGVGYMFMASLAMRFIGRKIFILDRLALSSSIGLDTPEAILQILKRVFIGILVIEGTGMLLLLLHWTTSGIARGGQAVFMALFHSISAFCNAGFDLFGHAVRYPGGFPQDNITLIILGSLIFFGGLGIPVLSELVTWTRIPKLSLHTRVTLGVVAVLITVGFLGTFLVESTSGVLVQAPLGQRLVQSWFHSVSSRTAGFAGLPEFTGIQPATQILTMVLMFIGSAPASMGGGITTGTFAVLGITLYNYMRGREAIQFWKREISYATVRRAGSVLTISVGLVMLATFLILATHPEMAVGPVLFEVVSAFATCGLSLGLTGALSNFGQIVIALVMIWGRLGALTIVIAVAQTSRAPQLLRYPEEQLLIG